MIFTILYYICGAYFAYQFSKYVDAKYSKNEVETGSLLIVLLLIAFFWPLYLVFKFLKRK